MTANCKTTYKLGAIDTRDAQTGFNTNGYYLGKKGDTFHFQGTWDITCVTVECDEPNKCKGPAVNGPNSHYVGLASLVGHDVANAVAACGPFYAHSGGGPARKCADAILEKHFGHRDVRGALAGKLQANKGLTDDIRPSANVCKCRNKRFQHTP